MQLLTEDYEEAVRRHQDLKTAAGAVASSTEVARQALAVEAYRVELADATAQRACRGRPSAY